MQSTYLSPAPRAIVQRVDAGSRLSWLLEVNDHEMRRRRVFRNGFEEEQMLLMRHPIAAERAYATLGLLLGAIPPAAILVKFFGYGLGLGSLNMTLADGALFFLCAVMNFFCCLVGYSMGLLFGRIALNLEHRGWNRMVVLMPMLGAAWGALTGIAGGFFFFGTGAIFGFAFGIPVGFFGFLAFATIHRALERGGMIEARHLTPLAFGIAAIIASLIFGL